MLNVIVNRSLDGKFKKLEQMIEGYTEIYAQKMAEEIVLRSPVDTGTYMEGHNLGVSAVGASSSSAGKPRKQPYQPYAQAALNQLFMQASALPHNAHRIVFSNDALHADRVEFLGWKKTGPYLVYTSAAREHHRIAKEAEAEAKARFR
jgi:hypothetical protein